MRLALIDAGLPEPLVNIAVYDASGGWVARPDLAWPEVKTAVEYDGAHHRDQPQWVRDLRRRECLEDAGWRVLVATAHDLGSLPAFTMRVASTLAERGLRWRGAPVH